MNVRPIIICAIAVFHALAQPPLPLKTSQFFGGPNDQSARALLVAPTDNAVFLGGFTGQVVRVAIPPAATTWSVQLQGGSYLGLTSMGSMLSGAGNAMPPACGASDGVGDTEPKSSLSRFAPTTGALVDCHSYNV